MVTPSLRHSSMVSSTLPPEWEIPVEASLHCPMGGMGCFIIERMCPEIERSSGCTPRKVLPSNFTLLGISPPIRWTVMVESVLIPCETKSAVFTALANTSTLPDPPVRSLRCNSPVPGAS